MVCGALGGKTIVSLKNCHHMSVKKPEASLQAIEMMRFKTGGSVRGWEESFFCFLVFFETCRSLWAPLGGTEIAV